MVGGGEDEPQSEDENEGSASNGGEEEQQGDEDDAGDLEDQSSQKIITDLLTGPLERCELAMQKRLEACKDPTLRLQATRTA